MQFPLEITSYAQIDIIHVWTAHIVVNVESQIDSYKSNTAKHAPTELSHKMTSFITDSNFRDHQQRKLKNENNTVTNTE